MQLTNTDMKKILQPYLERFQLTKGYFTGDKKNFQFFQQHSENTDRQDVLLKVGSIKDSDFSESQAKEPMATHIISLSIDERLKSADPQLIHDVSKLAIKEEDREFIGFASKFCNYHRPDSYPIFNLTLTKIISLNDKSDINSDTGKYSNDYQLFKESVVKFMVDNELEILNYWELNKFAFVYGEDIISKVSRSSQVK